MDTRNVLALVLVLGVLVIMLSLFMRHRNGASRINLDDLLLGDDGRLSKGAAVMLGSFALTSWIMVLLVLRDKMTEGYLAIYVGAWIAPTVTVLIKGRSAIDTPPAPPVGG